MHWLRTIRGFVRILIAVFVVGQFAGVNSLSPANAETAADTAGWHLHHQHVQEAEHGTAGRHHGDHKGPLSEHCCALHAFFVGIVCPTVTVEAVGATGTRLALPADTAHRTDTASRLDRPPRPLV